MEKNYKFISITSCIILIIGSIAALIEFFQFDLFMNGSEPSFLSHILYTFSSFNLFSLRLTYTSSVFQVWGVLFLIFLLVGLLFYIKSKGKDTRLLSFVFSVLFINNLVIICYKLLFYIFLFKKWETLKPISFFFIPLQIVTTVIYVFIAYKILKSLKSNKELDIVTTETSVKITDTGKWQRFFHFLIDTFIIALVFLPIIFSVFTNMVNTDEGIYSSSQVSRNILESRYTGIAIFVVLRFIYYPIFEIMFGSTPAKFLTESVVVNHKGEKPSVKDIFKRTLWRNIPFDSVSFLFGKGWHDVMSYTYIVKEKRTGFKTNRLLWILPFLAVYIPLAYFGDTLWNEYQSNKEYQEKQKNELIGLQNIGSKINSNLFFVLDDIDNYEYGKEVYAIKVEKVIGDSLLVTKLFSEYVGDSTFESVMSLYAYQKDTAKTEIISKKNLAMSIPKSAGDRYKAENGVKLFKGNIKYTTSAVFEQNVPYLKGSSNASTFGADPSKNTSVAMQSLGANGKILTITNKDNDLTWKTKFPIEFRNGELVQLETNENIKFDKTYESEITVVYDNNKIQKYIMNFTSGYSTLIRIQ